ncbi:YHYH protein [Pseudoalteromonas sp. SMS1]|uniref:YHYH protein n=1 Tax=Pseudoalteromonas sp. SMS1 TaxID=2908894 RepID=UPI001F429112|nr:YHYH protein [Pseudoalteromonas sp. SMS1]MCF2857036.1 YHYH protein [Pseudoalteromonas sp. SMS1]
MYCTSVSFKRVTAFMVSASLWVLTGCGASSGDDGTGQVVTNTQSDVGNTSANNSGSTTSSGAESGSSSDQSSGENPDSSDSAGGDSNTAQITGSTDGVLCEYFHNEFNASTSVQATSNADWSCDGSDRQLTANGIPDHATGAFPNSGNPNTISEQNVSISYTLNPTKTDSTTTLGGPRGATGYVLNGVKIDANTAGSCDDSGNSCSLVGNTGSWSIEALGQTSFDFGTDDNNAHVQPDGSYHYHGMPEGFIALKSGNEVAMTLIGWAADGFPIYARYGYSEAENAESELKVMTGSYHLVENVSSNRPSTSVYALGTFAQDWEYVAGSGDLDECNGRFGVTPEFPQGIYHYYATDSYPYFQRCVKGQL